MIELKCRKLFFIHKRPKVWKKIHEWSFQMLFILGVREWRVVMCTTVFSVIFFFHFSQFNSCTHWSSNPRPESLEGCSLPLELDLGFPRVIFIHQVHNIFSSLPSIWDSRFQKEFSIDSWRSTAFSEFAWEITFGHFWTFKWSRDEVPGCFLSAHIWSFPASRH